MPTTVAVFSNLTDLYIKVQKNRADIDKKCPRTKCDKILKKVKKVKASVEFLQNTNITVLETLVDMLKNSSTATELMDLGVIKACLTDPTVRVFNILAIVKMMLVALNCKSRTSELRDDTHLGESRHLLKYNTATK